MPPVHRQTVTVLEDSGNCRELIAAAEELVHKLPLGDSLYDLETHLLQTKTMYNDVLEKLVAFRRNHVDYATKYIKTMAKERAKSSAAGPTTAETKGTGGSDFTSHL